MIVIGDTGRMGSLSYSESIVIACSTESLYDLDVTRMGEWSPVCKACWWDEGLPRVWVPGSPGGTRCLGGPGRRVLRLLWRTAAGSSLSSSVASGCAGATAGSHRGRQHLLAEVTWARQSPRSVRCDHLLLIFGWHAWGHAA
jgi:hypothetical protein